MHHARALCGILLLFHALDAAAFETRFEIDRSLKFADLERTGKPVARTVRTGDIYRSDASAVLSNVSFAKLEAASADFNHYKQMGMPNVLASRIVSNAPGDILYTWTHMSAAGQESKH